VKYNTKIIFISYFFARARLLKLVVDGFCLKMAQNTQNDAMMCLLGVHTMTDNILGFKFPKNRQKWPSTGTFELPRTASWWMTS